ncbi:hypothetical protein K443DRAFT_679544 [Laccaria amethystina LaAM-08-1]|jgi:hypothetical protein|uniref:Uncharacterized protein n=1 Tax=Laccaria amethystina LaAM-08-1 TaxID=1095629 RepID=A0A0C9XQK7_9AGAR|nr:hypothetical protein K443DRAFT_679544 [Laccaria amethystina LaAM-08-1]
MPPDDSQPLVRGSQIATSERKVTCNGLILEYIHHKVATLALLSAVRHGHHPCYINLPSSWTTLLPIRVSVQVAIRVTLQVEDP